MSYYQISSAISKKKIGYYPQTTIHNDPDGRLYRNGGDGSRLLSFDKLADYDPNIVLKWHQHAKETDLVDRSSLGFGLVVSDTFKAVLQEMNLPPHRFYPQKFKSLHPMTVNYSWFHFYNDIFQYVDFSKSEFEFFHSTEFHSIEKVKITSRDEYMGYLKKQKHQLGFRATKVILTDNFPNYDIFDTFILTYNSMLISEKLAHRILALKLTGIELHKFEFMEFRIG